MSEEINAYIEKFDSSQQAILVRLHETIMSVLPSPKEQYKWGRPVYATTKDVCYLQATKKYVTLGFFEFDKITTNKHLIEGTGKSMRHIKLSDIKDIEELQVTQMLMEVLE